MCTTQMVADIVQRVGGELCEITTLMGPGVDPHLYHPTRDDTRAIVGADLVLYSGLHLEGKMTELFERAAHTRRVVAVTGAIPKDQLLMHAGQPDPHVWMDPTLWAHTIDMVAAELTTLAPDAEATFAANAAQLHEDLLALDSYAARVLASVPERQRVLLTAHDAFAYFGRRYGYTVVGVQGISTESEAGLHDLQVIVHTLVERDVPAVFIESTIAPRNVRALRDGAQAEGHDVRLGGSLFSDAAGPAGTYESTYMGMIDHNVTIIARALGGAAPVRGMQDELTAPQ
ncbi:MAG: zinc ABC transporter substrate-binding protein [Phycisphaerales bacterium]|nr:zinc ABC transporter substrate-binding protein [Phycisphaerales bacterium]